MEEGEGGGGLERLRNFWISRAVLSSFFIISLASEERVSKQLKQVSVVGMLEERLKKYSFYAANFCTKYIDNNNMQII